MTLHAACCAVAVLTTALPLAAQDSLPPPTPAAIASEVQRRSAENLPLATAGAVAAMVAFTALFDPSIARAANKAQSSDLTDIGNNVDRLGEVSVIGPVLIGTTAAGLFLKNPELLRLAVRTAGAIGFVTIGVQALKFAVGRDRPYQDADFGADDFHPFTVVDASFPSGHTAAAFAMATTLGDAIGNRYAQGALYVLAAGTGWARIVLLRHWPSDVIAGAAVGILAGKLAVGKIKVFGFTAPKAIVTPDAVVVQYSFPLPRIR